MTYGKIFILYRKVVVIKVTVSLRLVYNSVSRRLGVFDSGNKKSKNLVTQTLEQER